ncbi:hypothetical protein GTCCBUS3UF5_8520 [Geobacillus thermoleovorans CCB_US3_UF5]|uniref:Uncharacterized protein n=1 Tax=Geobacillus thermoleovorans CCB_US3_UF5 TaxID=1111068 RepID=A0ABM5MES2_GEOTH|nr:hypothetical protein GTCCBUS3UF5_8520 [Geobacillus thermoleovorans CCB_US3_UF5]
MVRHGVLSFGNVTKVWRLSTEHRCFSLFEHPRRLAFSAFIVYILTP